MDRDISFCGIISSYWMDDEWTKTVYCCVAIILFTSLYVINRKYMKAIFIILLASTIHVTALCMLPIIFIVQGKVGNKELYFCYGYNCKCSF